MSTSTETQTRPEPAATEERKLDSLGNLGPIHLVACLIAAGAVVIAVNLTEWLR